VIIDHVVRYRVTTLALLSLFFPRESPDALRMLLTRLDAAGWLRKFPMGSREYYYILGPRALRNLEVPGNRAHRKAQGFSQPGLVNHLAIGYLCAGHGLLRLRPDEFVEFCPDHHRPGLPSTNYLLRVDGSDPVLYWAIVDTATPVKEFPRKVGKAVATRFQIPAFQSRILSSEFAVVVITGTEAKARQIEDALSDRRTQFSNAGVLVVPEIEPLLLM
jgi:hypothetical protein